MNIKEFLNERVVEALAGSESLDTRTAKELSIKIQRSVEKSFGIIVDKVLES